MLIFLLLPVKHFWTLIAIMWSPKKLCTREWVTSPSVSYIKYTVLLFIQNISPILIGKKHKFNSP